MGTFWFVTGTVTVRPAHPEYLSSSAFTITALQAHSSSGLVLATMMWSSPSSRGASSLNLMCTSFAGISAYAISASAMVVPDTQS